MCGAIAASDSATATVAIRITILGNEQRDIQWIRRGAYSWQQCLIQHAEKRFAFSMLSTSAVTGFRSARKRRYSQTSPHQATDHHVQKKRPNGPHDIKSNKICSLRRWGMQNNSGKISWATSASWKEEVICQPTPDFLLNCRAQDLISLQKSARYGSPDLSNLRGVRYMFH